MVFLRGMITKKLVSALRVVVQKLDGARVAWFLVGSASLAVQGVRIRPKDIDICTDKKGALLMDRLFREWVVKPVRFGRFGIFEDWFGKFMIEGVLVEVMGDLKVQSKDGKWISRTGRTKVVRVEGLRVPVYDLHTALKMYTKLGRPKDPYRIKKIKEALGRKG